MIKVRLHGTEEEIQKFEKYLIQLEMKKDISLLSISAMFSDRGPSKYNRKYFDIELIEK